MGPTGLRMLGLDEDQEIHGLVYLDMISDADRPRVAHLMQQAVNGTSSEFSFVAINGMHLQSNFAPLRDSDGRITALMGIHRDVSDCIALQRRQKHVALAMQAAQIGTWEYDLQQGGLTWSERTHHLFGVLQDDFEGTEAGFLRRVHPEDRDAARVRRPTNITGDERHERVYRIVRTDGAIRWISSIGQVIRDGSGNPSCIVGTCIDITDRIDMQHRLHRIQKLESLNTLAGDMAHDFNNLLTGVSANADWLAQLDQTDDALEAIEDIRISGRQAADLCQQLQTATGRSAMYVEAFDLSELVEQIRPTLASVMGEVTVVHDLAHDLPTITCDPRQIHQVVMHLLTNAAQAAPNADGRVTVRTSEVTLAEGQALYRHLDDLLPGTYVYLEVEDNGHGMDERTAERMFDPFFTTRGTARGLGLAVTLGIIRAHKGAIEVHSSAQGGTRIGVWLPISD
jgi:PAS domain S-box-containing protein